MKRKHMLATSVRPLKKINFSIRSKALSPNSSKLVRKQNVSAAARSHLAGRQLRATTAPLHPKRIAGRANTKHLRNYPTRALIRRRSLVAGWSRYFAKPAPTPIPVVDVKNIKAVGAAHTSSPVSTGPAKTHVHRAQPVSSGNVAATASRPVIPTKGEADKAGEIYRERERLTRADTATTEDIAAANKKLLAAAKAGCLRKYLIDVAIKHEFIPQDNYPCFLDAEKTVISSKPINKKMAKSKTRPV
jgi:hypothetical protein